MHRDWAEESQSRRPGADAFSRREVQQAPHQAETLALQRTAGNRAVNALLARVAAAPSLMLQRAEAEDLAEINRIAAREGDSTLGKMLAEVVGVAPKCTEWKPVPTSGYVVKRNNADVDNRRYLVAYQAANDDDALRYGNLVHELTHASVDQSYDREFVNYEADVSYKKRATTEEEWEAKGFAKENEYLLSYFSRPEYNAHLTGILVGLSSAADTSGLPEDQVARIKGALMYGSKSPATEFDTVVNQSLTWMHLWGVSHDHTYYKQVEAVAEDARARRAGEKTLDVELDDTPPVMTPVTYATPPTKGKQKKAKKPKKKRKFCYLTTACTARRGLADDCAELTTLRRFRDDHILRLPGGEGLVDAYYATAPAIVTAIDGRADAHDVYDAIYDVVAACVAAIDAGDHDEALHSYADMVTGLEALLCPGSDVAAGALAKLVA
jgi:hypothetical protein